MIEVIAYKPMMKWKNSGPADLGASIDRPAYAPGGMARSELLTASNAAKPPSRWRNSAAASRRGAFYSTSAALELPERVEAMLNHHPFLFGFLACTVGTVLSAGIVVLRYS